MHLRKLLNEKNTTTDYADFTEKSVPPWRDEICGRKKIYFDRITG